METKDNDLIRQAEMLDHDDWQGVERLIPLTDDENVQQELRRIARWYYHNEEYS